MKSDKLLVPTEKTSNFYKMDTQSYNDLLKKNITKTYKKVTPDTADSIELKAKDIANKLQLDSTINTCLVPVRRLSRPSRSMHFGDVSETNGRETPRQSRSA